MDESDADYLSRRFLIAMPSMQDPNFERGVTLICQHSEEGATGININRPSEHTLGDIFSQLGFACDDALVNAQPVLEGGPVHQERGFVLHGSWDDARPHPLSIFSHYILHWVVAIAFFLLYVEG